MELSITVPLRPASEQMVLSLSRLSELCRKDIELKQSDDPHVEGRGEEWGPLTVSTLQDQD